MSTIENPTVNKANGVITLKEITDLITVEHNKAMKVVERLCLEPTFGGVEKLATPTYNPNGSFNRNIDTYLLTKKQAIAVGAKLNDSLLMKVIDRLEELENKNKPAELLRKDLALLIIKAEEEKELLLIENKKQSQFITNVVHNHNTYTATQVAKDLNISAKLFNKILIESGVLFKNNGTYALTSRYQNYGLTEIKETEPNQDDKTFLSLRWTAKGKSWLKNNFEKALHKCTENSFNEYNRQILSNLPTIPNSRVKRF